MVNKVTELETELRRMREEVNIWELLSEHRLPFGHERHLRAMVASMEERTPYAEVLDALSQASGEGAFGEAAGAAPRRHSLVELASEGWREGYVRTSCTCLAQAAELHGLGTRASPEVRPLLLSECSRLLMVFLVRSVTRLDRVPRDMGVSVELEGGDVSAMRLHLEPDGFLARVAVVLAALERPSALSPVVPDLETFKEERWYAYPQRTELSLDKRVSVSLEDLVGYDFETDARSLATKWMIEGFHSRYVDTSRLLRSLALNTAAAEVAGGEPAAWREVLRGEVTEAGRHFEEAQSTLREAVRTVHEVLAAVEAGEKAAYVATGYHYV
jgi:hypothetical protein